VKHLSSLRQKKSTEIFQVVVSERKESKRKAWNKNGNLIKKGKNPVQVLKRRVNRIK